MGRVFKVSIIETLMKVLGTYLSWFYIVHTLAVQVQPWLRHYTQSLVRHCLLAVDSVAASDLAYDPTYGLPNWPSMQVAQVVSRVISPVTPRTWADATSRSTLAFQNLHHTSIGVQNCGFYFLDPGWGGVLALRAAAVSELLQRGNMDLGQTAAAGSRSSSASTSWLAPKLHTPPGLCSF